MDTGYLDLTPIPVLQPRVLLTIRQLRQFAVLQLRLTTSFVCCNFEFNGGVPTWDFAIRMVVLRRHRIPTGTDVTIRGLDAFEGISILHSYRLKTVVNINLSYGNLAAIFTDERFYLGVRLRQTIQRALRVIKRNLSRGDPPY